ncbi:GyrI-like domain-containing protein [Candidatus Gracilibacteria bacterium]|nr:GyrI-like domain-containing protein [Candidatus Gracilibacteria bacterium]
MDVEIAVPVVAPLAGGAPVQTGTLPAVGLLACLLHVGDDSGLGQACAALHRWIASNGYTAAGPYRECYHRYCADAPLALPPAFIASHPAAAIIELQVPVVPVRAA